MMIHGLDSISLNWWMYLQEVGGRPARRLTWVPGLQVPKLQGQLVEVEAAADFSKHWGCRFFHPLIAQIWGSSWFCKSTIDHIQIYQKWVIEAIDIPTWRFMKGIATLLLDRPKKSFRRDHLWWSFRSGGWFQMLIKRWRCHDIISKTWEIIKHSCDSVDIMVPLANSSLVVSNLH